MAAETAPVHLSTHTVPGVPSLDATFYRPAGEGPFPAVLLCHGLLSCQAEFSDFPERLARLGLASLTFDFRGHGKSGGDRGYYTADWHLGDALRALDHLRAQAGVDPERLVVLGHSLGTGAALRLAARRPEGLRGLVLVAPMARFTDLMSPVQKVAYRVGAAVAGPLHRFTGIHVHGPYPVKYEDIFFDPTCAAAAKEIDPIQSSTTLLNWGYLSAYDNVPVAAGVDLPSLVVVGKEDRVVPNPESRKVYEALVAEDKEWVAMHQAGHSIMGDAPREQFAEIVGDWIKARAGRVQARTPEA